MGNLFSLQELRLNDNTSLTGTLPQSLTGLTKLSHFQFHNTGLCAPLDGAFQTWLQGIEDTGGSNCSGGGTLSTDRDALVALYNATDGDSWTDRTNWLTDADLSTWHGVTVSDGRVTQLEFYRNNLSGTIPAALGGLSSLQKLKLGGNELSGSIPAALGNLPNLEILWLGGNALSGSIPSELGNLFSLQELRLSGNELSGSIPPALGDLSNLEILWLGGNELSGSIPSELGDLSNLTGLWLHDNASLTGTLPHSLTGLTKLKFFYFYNTGLCAPLDGAFQTWLQGIEDTGGSNCSGGGTLSTDRDALVALYNATDGDSWTDRTDWLTDADLSTWHGVTVSDGRVTRLQLDGNNLSGTIPAALGGLSNLAGLDLSDNALSGLISSELGNLSNLTSLLLNDNTSLTGTLPQSLTRLTNLKSFHFHNTGLCAPLDGAFQTWLQGIEDTHGSNCSLSTDRDALIALYHATDGDSWTDRTNWLTDADLSTWHGVTVSDGRVTRVQLDRNNLSGTIPAALGGLSILQKLQLSGNNALSGPIPPALGDLSNLEILWLGGNELSGSIPSELGDLSNLRSLALLDNALSGSIPSELGNLSNLRSLALSRNALSGSIPAALGNLSNLTGLGLNDNALSGPIPSELGNLSNLRSLSLSRNALSGSIPAALGNLSNLTSLGLYGNDLSGSIPSELGNLSNLRILSLGRNALSGPIPPALGNLSSLTDLWLGDNALSGSIPSELGNLSNLTDLSLGRNALSGPIPPALGNLSSLTDLWLSVNALSGPIPPALGNLSNLTDLRLDDNVHLTGTLPQDLTRLTNLKYFHFHNTGLCAPLDDAFQAWLQGIGDTHGSSCASSG